MKESFLLDTFEKYDAFVGKLENVFIFYLCNLFAYTEKTVYAINCIRALSLTTYTESDT